MGATLLLVDPLGQGQSITGVHDDPTRRELRPEFFEPRFKSRPIVNNHPRCVQRRDVLRAGLIVMRFRPRRHQRLHPDTVAADSLGELLQGVECHHHRQGSLRARSPCTAQRANDRAGHHQRSPEATHALIVPHAGPPMVGSLHSIRRVRAGGQSP